MRMKTTRLRVITLIVRIKWDIPRVPRIMGAAIFIIDAVEVALVVIAIVIFIVVVAGVRGGVAALRRGARWGTAGRSTLTA